MSIDLADLLTAAAYAALCLGSERDAAELRRPRDSDSRARWTIPTSRMINSGNLGLAALLTGDTDTASHAFREELALCREMVVRPVAFEGLRGLAAVAAVHGDDQRAATLVGAADAHRYDAARGSASRPGSTRRSSNPPARATATDAWNAAAREGGALSFEDAIAYALEEPRP